MTKVLLIQDVISNYRVPVFNLISKKYDFTVSYVNGEAPRDANFKCIKVSKENMDYVYDYDILICAPNFQNLKLLKTIKKFGRKKTIYYGIGVSASYKHSYDSQYFVGLLFSIFLKWIGAAIFYCDYPRIKYIKMGINREKLFVANNTVIVNKIIPDNSKKKDIIFVGTLYKEKGISLLLENYYRAFQSNRNIPKLIIVGDGPEKNEIITFIQERHLNDKIIMKGPIYDEEKLSSIFETGIACISPSQAGLSVLKSMGYGVPFITNIKAITGGEVFNIKDNNGILYKDSDELETILLDITNNRDKYLELGKKAKEYYYNNCTIEQMANGFIEAIKYVENN